MGEAIFLSASVPDPARAPEFAKTADSVAIAAAVTALLHVTLGRRKLIWGGHPAITPMIWVVAEELGVDYGAWVQLYQSTFFEDEFPEDNERFRNIVFTNGVEDDRQKSLAVMREHMFRDHDYSAAVFIGGMGGILDEFALFRHFQPDAATVPVASTGGAALTLAEKLPGLDADLAEDLDFVAVFHRHLGISPRERRYPRPEDQPLTVEERFWTPDAPRRDG